MLLRASYRNSPPNVTGTRTFPVASDFARPRPAWCAQMSPDNGYVRPGGRGTLPPRPFLWLFQYD